MNKTRHLLASAPIAIAAMAALSATPALAQETPVIVLDVPTPASTPAPVIAIPEAIPTATSTTAAEPVVQATAQPEARVGTSSTAATTASPAPARNTTAARAAPPIAAAQMDSGSPEAAPPVAAPLPATIAPADPAIGAAPVPVELEPVPEPVRDGSSAALLFALLAAGGVGLGAFFMLRSLRRRVVDVPVIEKPVVTREVEPFEREPTITVHDAAPVMAPAAAHAFTEPSVAPAHAEGATVVLPPVPPTTELERDRLLRRMIAAKPDRANPFQSHKARAKRARLILQSIGTRFTDRKPGIDLSQHTNVWPELRGWRPATA